MTAGPRGHLHKRSRRVLAKLRINGSKRGMAVQVDLVRRQGDQGAATHRVVRDDGYDSAVVIAQGTGNLAGREHEAPGRVEDDLDRTPRRRRSNRSKNALGVVDVDVPHDRKAK